MSSSRSLAQLALAGIAAGFLSHSVLADEMPMAKKAAPAMSKPDSSSTATLSSPAKPDSVSAAMAAQHECKGHNSCKGMGGCKMSEKDLKKAAKKAGVPMAKAGKAHDCKGKNECKGMGGCKTM